MKNLKIRAALAASLCLLVCVCLLLPGCEKRLERPGSAFITQAYLHFSDKKDYDEFIQKNDLPERFVPYSCISGLGDFVQCNIYNDLNDLQRIRYTVKDLLGIVGDLYSIEWNLFAVTEMFGHSEPPAVYTHTKSTLFNSLFGFPDEKNMLLFPKLTRKEASGYVRTQNEIWYGYGTDGNLVSVTWFYNNYRFWYYLREIEFSDYPDMTADTFTVKLLNVETAEQAIEELMRACFPDQEYTGLQRVKVPKFKN